MSNLTLEQQSKFSQKKISSLYKEIQSIHELAKTVDESEQQNFPAFRGKFRDLEKLLNELIRLWDELLMLYIVADKEKEFPYEDGKLKKIRALVYECNSVYENVMNPSPIPKTELMSQADPNSTYSHNMSMHNTSLAVRSRLPKISIPTFDGDLLEWPKFRDLFVSLVHEEGSLPPIDKFHYLIGNLTSEPLRIVTSLSITAANYEIAWKALLERYNNKRILASVYFHKIRQFKLTTPSSSNSNHLRSFLKVVADNFAALNCLKIEDEADYLKLQLALDCLDPDTRKLYEEKQHGQEFPSYDSLITFITQRCQILELSESDPSSNRNLNLTSNFKKSRSFTALVQKGSQSQTSTKYSIPPTLCPNCKRDHPLFKCFSFKSMPVEQRARLVRSNNLCLNCLRPGHYAPKCKSQASCFHCKGRHHTFLHNFPSAAAPLNNQDNSKPTGLDTPQTSGSNREETHYSGIVGATAGSNKVLLGTALAKIRDWQGEWQQVRIVLDSCSHFSIITTDCARRLGLHYSPSSRKLTGVGQTNLPKSKGNVQFQLTSIVDQTKTVDVKALVMNTLTYDLPTVGIHPSYKHHFESVDLADKTFWDPRPVDFLLGTNLFFRILTNEPRVEITKDFGTLPTIFGHVVMGELPDLSQHETSICLALTENPISDNLLKKFWEIEEIPSNELHPDDRQVEERYDSTVQRLNNGRYMVSLPLIDPDRFYPSSMALAQSRFMKLESRLSKDPHLKAIYSNFMKEYIDLGHMQVASNPPKYVIPHHAVFKKTLNSNEQPKLRVVFDASMITPEGSLNDNLLAGPPLQQNIFTVLLNFRTHRIGFCVDIVKMFRQILVVPEHRSFQTIFWRFSPENVLQLYELNTVTNGETSSSYLAIKTVKTAARDERERFPKAADLLERDAYVDNVISGADTVEEALELKTQLIGLLDRACFPLHEWASNSEEFILSVHERPQEPQVSFPPDDNNAAKILGMHWDPKSDVFSYKISFNGDNTQGTTKRSMLSIVARLFDPLGLLAPIILLAKSMIQELWKLKVDWDDLLPSRITETWLAFIEDLPIVRKINVPRWVCCSLGLTKIFGFCDASEKGYAAAIYIRVEEPSLYAHTFLLTAKTRLAPVKTISVPRLELCGAQLLIKLLNSIKDTTVVKESKETLLFTDSTIVLSWLRLHPQQLKTFVANRVSYIISNSEILQWHHVPSAHNPADIASRGHLASALLENELWWKGPEWMKGNPLELPTMPTVLQDIPEQRSLHPILMNTEICSFLINYIDKHSNFRFMVRSLAYVLRFLKSCKQSITNQSTSHPDPLNKGPLSVSELEEATHRLICNVQQEGFKLEFNYEENCCISSRFKSLMAFRDSSGLLRVGGRLSNAALPYDSMHPIILPYDVKLTAMIIDHYHKEQFHLGAKALQSYIQRKFYIFRIKSVIRKRIWNCIRCFKLRAKPNNPLMADLPKSRVTQGRVFLSVGVDFAGPYYIKQGQRRNSPTSKAYMCIFICMSVKAVHIEIVTSLSTEAFLSAFNRFIARRGLPSQIRSDCGTNFIGAARHLRELYEWYNKADTQDTISRRSSDLGVQWDFNPPSAPHFGGLWEAAVKSAKMHLRRTLGDRPFYLEELQTIFIRIEAVMNSRPLGAVTANPNDFDYLTPGHFLIGAPLLAPPERDISLINMDRLRRWQLLQASVQTFWKRWSSEYVQLLHIRTKWTKTTNPIKIGDLVLIQDTNHQPLNWKIGRIVNVYPDKTGVIRVATVKTSSGEVKRPVHRLAPLDPINTLE